MKPFIFFFLALYISVCAFSQSGPQPCVVFTTNNGTNDVLWRMKAGLPAVYENISDALDAYSLYSGIHKGPVSISQNGEWFIFRSTRFDAASAANGEAITLAKYDMSVIETPMNPNPNWYYGEGLAQVSNDGQSFIYVDAGSVHSRDVFKVNKVTATSWSPPVNLTANSAFSYNTNPRFSEDQSKVIFNASEDPYIASNISMTDFAGNVTMLLATTDIAACGLLNSGNLLTDGTLIFEAETDAERIWTKNTSASYSAINTSMTNDNSPCIARSKILSLSLPGSTHQIKMMNMDGSNPIMLTSSNALFDEVMDIGISGATYMQTTALAMSAKQSIDFELFPNPSNGHFTLKLPENTGTYQIQITDIKGQILFSESATNAIQEIKLNLAKGLYFLNIRNEKGTAYKKILIE
jgi:Secretion system C-terminal sorting domain